MTSTTRKVVAGRQCEKKIAAYDCYMSVVEIIPNTIYMSLFMGGGTQGSGGVQSAGLHARAIHNL